MRCPGAQRRDTVGKGEGERELSDREEELLRRIMALSEPYQVAIEGFIEGLAEWRALRDTMTEREQEIGVQAAMVFSMAMANCVRDRFGGKEGEA